MADLRELILDRFHEVLLAAFPAATVERNPATIDDLDLPLVAMADGGEANNADSDVRNAPRSYKNRVTMNPEVLIRVAGTSATIGTMLNGMRATAIKAVLEDAQLAALVSNGGEVRYVGASVALALGRSTTGDMALAFSFSYVLRPDQLP